MNTATGTKTRTTSVTRNRTRRGYGAVLAIVFAMGVSAAAQAATTLYVDGTLGSDANPCTASGLSACKPIQAAINKASAGDTIIVAAGLYPEAAPGPLSVNKTLTLLGAQAGVDARGRLATESTVADSQGTYITANKVVIDGFTIENSTNSAFTGYGIAMGAGTTGTKILNNIIQSNIAGIALANTGATQALIRHNLIQNNNQAGSASGTGIYTDEYVCGFGMPCSNFLIDENEFRGHVDAGIFISNTDVPNPLTKLDVSANLF